MAAVAWIRDHSLDVDADMRRFYGFSLEEAAHTMDSVEFYGLALRLVNYKGAMFNVIHAQHEREKQEAQTMTVADAAAEFGDMIEYTRV